MLYAQPIPTNITATPQPGNVLRYDLQFTTPQGARGFVEYAYRSGLDSIRNKTGSTDSGTNHAITVLGLVAQTTYRYRAVAWDANGCYASAWDTFTTAAIPPSVTYGHVLNVSGTAGYPLGYLLSNTAQGDPDRYLQIHDRLGHLIWYERMPGIAAAAFDGPCQHFSYRPSSHSIFMTECDRVTELALDGTVLRSVNLGAIAPGWVAHHDVVRIPNGNWLVLAAQVDTVDKSAVGGDPNALVVCPGILEIDPSGALVWSWSAADHLDPLTSPGPGGDWVPKWGPQAINWLDANSLMQDGDGNPMLSLGGTSQVIKLVRNGGNIVWTLGPAGDIEILPLDSFSHQHALRAGHPGYYLSLDNEGLGHLSRLTEWWIDFAYINPRVQMQQQFTLPLGDYSPDDGNIDLLPNGDWLIGAPGGRTITELSSAGSVLWRAQLDSSLYRAYWVDDFYARLHPHYVGDLVVCLQDSLVPLRADVAGGIWSGPFVEGDSFNTAAAGQGLHQVTYKLGPEEFTVELLVDASLQCNVGLAEAADFQMHLVAFPNPVVADLQLRWEMPRADGVTVALHGLDGRVLWQRDLGRLGAGSQTLHLDATDWGGATGAIVVTVRTKSGETARRIILPK